MSAVYALDANPKESLIDVSHWPIVVVRPTGPVSDQAFVQAISDYTMAISKHLEPHTVLLDLRHNPGLTPKQRNILTDGFKPGKDNIQPGCQGTALVFTSKLLKSMLTAMFWIRRPPQITKVFNSITDAETWCFELQQKARRLRPENPDDAKIIFAMCSAGPRFARKYGLLKAGERHPSEIEAARRWPELVEAEADQTSLPF